MSTEQITIRLPVERVAALKAAAMAETRSLAQQVEHLLKQGNAMADRCAELESELAGRQPAQGQANRPTQATVTPRFKRSADR
ncbi:MAG TPA: hypothetical protein VIM11_25690 [Tepidisphaeraceae bacterium]|jgi:hypothetical protein